MALLIHLHDSGYDGDADGWLDIINLYGPAMKVTECITAYQTLSKMIATSPSARFQHKLPIFRKGHSLLHSHFLMCLVDLGSDHQETDASIISQARKGLEISGISLMDIGVVLVSIAATADKSSNAFGLKASSASSLAWVLSQHSLDSLQSGQHGLSPKDLMLPKDLMHWLLHPLSKIFGEKLDLSLTSPWTQIIHQLITNDHSGRNGPLAK